MPLLPLDEATPILDRLAHGDQSPVEAGRAVVVSDDPVVSFAANLTRFYGALLTGGLAGRRTSEPVIERQERLSEPAGERD